MNQNPKHIAVIIDGNGRWASRHALPRIIGHQVGAEAARNLVKMCINHQVKILSLFVFSSENWRRPKEEVSKLLNLCLKLLKEEILELHHNNIKLNVIGDSQALPLALREAISDALSLTINNTGLILNIAINYGGKWDILNATKQIAQDYKANKIKESDFNENLISNYLSLAGLPDPELMIRTSGEYRISNFFLWQSAYTELFFTDVLWPDFGINDFRKALDFFKSRTRKFGGLLTKAHG